MSSFTTVLAGVIGVLGLKMALTHLLTIRTRFIEHSFKTPEDSQMPALLTVPFKVMLFAFGPAIPVQRLHGVVSNSIENEPYFVLLAVALGQMGLATAQDAQLVQAYAALRVAHAVFYLLALQPFRGFAYLGGLGINVYFAARLVALLL